MGLARLARLNSRQVWGGKGAFGSRLAPYGIPNPTQEPTKENPTVGYAPGAALRPLVMTRASVYQNIDYIGNRALQKCSRAS